MSLTINPLSMGKNNNKSLKTGNYEFRAYNEKVVVDVKRPKYIKKGDETVQDGFLPVPVFTLGYSSEQFGYGLLRHLMDQKDGTALENFGAISFAMNSLFASNAEFRNEVQNLINKHLNPDGQEANNG
ncbi:hypothetical protein M2132_001050 [Dysgonomonas sp. PH5-45]|nr:hypothetical protein [Dysgonomonas sp. PH5-45]MDH6387620.1 hypothetical protein [Dysgonomonas sp. PH5-37]